MITTHQPTIDALARIKVLKNELARLMFDNYLALDSYDKKYVDVMVDDDEISG